MVDGPRLDTYFTAMASPIRRAMLERLSLGDATVKELASGHAVSAPAISQHLRVLRNAGFIAFRSDRADGRVRRVRMDPRPLRAIASWIQRHEAFWNARLDSLASYAEAKQRMKSKERKD
jgi:DNA-binding transcriptional ArsR family regulator